MNLPLRNQPAEVASALLMLAPLGVPLSVEVGRASDATAIATAGAGWEGVPLPGCPAIPLRIERASHLVGTEGTRISLRGTAVQIRGPGVAALADPEAGFAWCEASADYLAAPRRLREDVIEPLVLMLLSRCDRTPLHASCFISDGLAIVLAGRSGAGKSCLAKAADDAGFQLLSEDIVYVQQVPRLRVWGWSTTAHLLPADCASIAGPTRLRNGKLKRVVAMRSASSRARSCERATLCVLGKGDEVSLSRLARDAAMSRLFPLDPGFDLLPQETGRAIAALTAKGAWELRLSDDPAAAVRLLAGSLARLRETAAP